MNSSYIAYMTDKAIIELDTAKMMDQHSNLLVKLNTFIICIYIYIYIYILLL
jgi:hypothetical protein